MVTRFLAAITALIPIWVFAEPQQSGVEDLSIYQVVTPLILVIVLIFLLAWLVKKVNPTVSSMGQGITVVASAPLSSNARVCLVRVGDKDILLGVTSQQITPLHTFEEPPVNIPDKENATEFAGHFKRLLKTGKPTDESSTQA